MYHNDTTELTLAILDGKNEDGALLDAAMPQFSGKLSEDQVAAIVSYMLTLK